MKIAKVSYTTQAEYAEQNKTNIQAVMNDLQRLKHPGIRYNCTVGADGKSFMHFAFFQSDDDQKVLFDLPSFQHFQQQLKASGPETPPKSEALSLVGASYPIF